MEQKLKLYLIFFLIYNSAILQLKGQDIYNLENSKRYAEYLYKSMEFKKASIELERICFLDSNDWNSKLLLMKSYRKVKNYEFAIMTYRKNKLILPDSLKSTFSHEYYISLFNYNPNIFKSDSLKEIKEFEYFTIPALLLSNKWKTANRYFIDKNIANDLTINSYKRCYKEALKIKYKKPWIATTISVIIPGSGKIYSGYFKDGIISFLFTGLSAFQAYRGFETKGIKSGIFFIYSGITAGFYLGNIYGAYKSAKQRNKVLKNKINNNTYYIFNDWAN